MNDEQLPSPGDLIITDFGREIVLVVSRIDELPDNVHSESKSTLLWRDELWTGYFLYDNCDIIQLSVNEL